MSDINIDSLRIEAKTNIKEAISDIEALKQSLTGLGDGKSGVDRYSASVNGLTQKLTRLTQITDKSGIAAVEKSVRELAEASIKLNNLQLDEKKGSIFSESTWNDALKNVESAMENVKNTIAQKMREVKPLEGVEKDFDNYIRKAGKVKIPIGVKNDLKVDKEFSNLRSVLGKNFSTTNNGVDFVKFVEDMNNAIHTTFDTTQNATDLFKEVVNSLKDIRKEATLTAQDVVKNGLLPVKEIESELSKFAAKDIPNLNEKYNLNASELYADKAEKSEESSANAVKEVTTAVNQKTKAFEKEQKTVADVIQFEMKELINLRTTIESVTKAVSAKSGLTQAFENLSSSGLKDLASLKSIDFSGLAKLNTKALQGTLKQITDIKNIGQKTTRELARNAELKNALGSSSPEHLVAKTAAKGNEINIPTRLSEIQSLYQKLINYKGELIESINEMWNSNNSSLDTAVDKISKYREQLAQTRSSIKQVGEVLAAVRNETDITKGEQWITEYNSFLGNMQEYRTKISRELLETLQAEPKNSPKLNLMESLSDLGTVTDSVEQKLSELFDMLQALPSATDKAESQARTMLTQSAQQLGLAAESIENALSTLHGTAKEYSITSETSAPIDDLNNHVNLVAQSLSSLDSALQLTQNEVRAFAETGQLSETALQALSNASQTSDMVIEHMNSSISELTGNLSFYRQSLEQASQEPSIFKDMPEDVNRLNQDVQRLPLSLSRVKSDISDLAGIMGSFAGKAMSVVTVIGKIGSMAISTSKKIGSLVKDFAKLSWQSLNFGSGKNALSGLRNPLNQSSASLGDFNKKLKHGITMVLRYGFGIRSLYVLFNKLRSGIQDGFNNLVIYSDKANQSLSLLQADLSYVGNSAAAAFEPILNVVAPIIDQIVDYMVAGINSVGAFIAAITGQSSYTVAVKNIKSYRDSLSGAASAGDAASDATDKVKDSAEELKRELMGFDEIEKFSEDLNDAANSGAGGSGGSGSGNKGGTEDPILFTKKDIPGAVSNFADLVKEGWAKSDFTEVGNIVGIKLRDALDSIDWEPIKAQANKIAKVTGTFINGFFETEGLDKSVGRTVGEALNTAIGAVNTFIDVAHWNSIGKFMSGGLRSAIDTIDWDGLGKALNAKYTALWGFIDGFVVDMSRIDFEGTTGWQEAGNALAETINSIFANRDYEKVGTTIANGINGIASTLETGVNKIEFNKISQRFANGVNNVFSGVDFNAIGSAISSGLNQATSSLRTFAVTINWKQIGKDIANSANKILADTDFSLAGKALGSAFKGVLSSINEAAATFNWRSLGVDINHFIKGINWKGVLKTAANTVANTFFGLFETAWGVVFGGSDTKYTAIADNLNQALSKLKIEWPAMEEEELEKFNNVSAIVDKFLELNEKLKKNGSLSETDMSLFKTYYDQIVEYAPQAADLIGKVGEAYEGTDKALKDLIESQKNAAITKGFEQAMTDAAKIYADSATALNGAVTELVDSVVANKNLVFDAWSHDKGGTMEEFEESLDSLFEKMRSGKLDLENLSDEEARLLTAFQRTTPEIFTQTSNVANLTDNLNDSREELGRISEAQEEFRAQMNSTAGETKKSSKTISGNYKTVLKSAEAVDSKNRTMQEHIAVWLSDLINLSEIEKSALFDYMTGVTERSSTVDNAISKLSKSQQQKIEATGKAWRTAKNDANGYATEIGNLPTEVVTDAVLKVDKSELYKTGTDLIDNPLELNSKMVVAGVDKSKLTDEDKTFNATARFKNMIDALGDKIFPTIANFISQIDSLPAVGKIFSTVAKFTSREDAIKDRKISNLTAMLTNITTAAALVVPSASAVVTRLISGGGLSVANVKGFINQVTKQSGASLILSGIHGIISSITSIFGRKAEGGAFYGGSWHNIAQFRNGGIIKPNMIMNFNMIPRYAGGTLDSGSMFIAGEAGPELVGHVGGRTEVLNQSQLASVMQSAVASGMEAVMARYGGNGGGNGNVTVNVVLQGDAKKIFEVVKKENNSRVIQTGKAQLLT